MYYVLTQAEYDALKGREANEAAAYAKYVQIHHEKCHQEFVARLIKTSDTDRMGLMIPRDAFKRTAELTLKLPQTFEEWKAAQR